MPMLADSRTARAARMFAVARPPVNSGCEADSPTLKLYCDAKMRVIGLSAADVVSLPPVPVPPLEPRLDRLAIATNWFCNCFCQFMVVESCGRSAERAWPSCPWARSAPARAIAICSLSVVANVSASASDSVRGAPPPAAGWANTRRGARATATIATAMVVAMVAAMVVAMVVTGNVRKRRSARAPSRDIIRGQWWRLSRVRPYVLHGALVAATHQSRGEKCVRKRAVFPAPAG